MPKYVINYTSFYEVTGGRYNPYGTEPEEFKEIRDNQACEVVEADTAGEAVELFKKIHDELADNPKVRFCGYSITSVVA